MTLRETEKIRSLLRKSSARSKTGTSTGLFCRLCVVNEPIHAALHVFWSQQSDLWFLLSPLLFFSHLCRSEKIFQRMWQEVFALLYIPFIFVIHLPSPTSSLHPTHAIKRPLLGVVEVLSDHGLKPLLTTLHNAVIQPLTVFMWNVPNGIVYTLSPLIDLVARLAHLVTDMIAAFRLVQVGNDTRMPRHRSSRVRQCNTATSVKPCCDSVTRRHQSSRVVTV